jgi:hypothetical protein
MIGWWSITATILSSLYGCAGRRAGAVITALVGRSAERVDDA